MYVLVGRPTFARPCEGVHMSYGPLHIINLNVYKIQEVREGQ